MSMTKLVPPNKLADFGILLGDRQRRRLEDAGQFPKRVPISGRRHGYVAEEIAAHIERLIAEARQGAA
jgi:hypothetical protein